MKKILSIFAMCFLLAGTHLQQAEASSYGIYVVPKVGLSLQGSSDSHFASSGAANSSSNLASNFGMGLVGGIAIGYDMQYSESFMPLRFEGEILLRTSTSADAQWTGGGQSFDVEQKIGMNTYFINAYYDFYNSSPLVPYVGLGLGFASIKHNVEVNSTNYSKSETNFAFNIGAGVSWLMGGNFTADVGYRYVYPTESTVKFTTGTNIYKSSAQPSAHELMLGIRYTF